MKRKLIAMLLAVMLVLSVLAVAACDKDPKPGPDIGADHDHVFGDWTIDTEADCIHDGSKHRSCTVEGCSETETEVVPALGHDYAPNWICKRCGFVLDENHSHSYGEWIVVADATCEKDGSRYRVCACGDRETEVLTKLGHDWGEWVVVAEPTCSTIGQQARYCKREGCEGVEYVFTKTIPHTMEDGKCKVCGYDPSASYTYNASLSTFPTNWNPHVYQTNTDATILDYTTMGFYGFDYNENLNGYKMVTEMASAFPVDVTADYVGRYGIKEGDTAKVWKIALNTNAKFDNGDPINADTYVESLKLLLNPVAANYRADSVYSGDMKIFNAENYLKQGKTLRVSALEKYTEWDKAVEEFSDKLIFDLSASHVGNWLSSSYSSYVKANGAAWTVSALFGTATEAEVKSLEGKSYAEISADATLNDIWTRVLGAWQTDPNEELHFWAYDYTYPTMNFDEVGIESVDGGNSLVLALINPLEGFYLHYSLTSSWLVHPATYKACESNKDGIYSNTYGTSADKYVGYGPYKLTYFLKDAEIKFHRNDSFYGFESGKTYQATDINIKYVEQASTRLSMFLSGQLDAYGLTAEDMKDYQSSKHTYYTDGDSTWFMAFNPDVVGLKAAEDTANEGKKAGEPHADKEILSIKEFRQAWCYALDRAKYALTLDPMGNPAKALYSTMIISDPENGTAYRTTEEAKKVIVAFWGLADEVGEGKTYATLDDAIEAISGYNLAKAKELFNVAYDKAIELGYMTENDYVEIQIGIPKAAAAYYSNGADFIINNYTEAVKGTKLEGKLKFTKSGDLGNSFSDYLKNNTVDLLFGVGWTGSALNPYGLIEAYTTSQYQYDPGWDTSATTADVALDLGTGEKTYRASVLAWTEALGGKEIEIAEVVDGKASKDKVKFKAGTEADMSIRLKVLAALEGAVLEQYDMIPLLTDSSAALKGMQIKYYTEEYVYGVGRGGVKYMTFNYTDGDWDAFVKSQGGTLNYKAA